jgi:hypothetical protein
MMEELSKVLTGGALFVMNLSRSGAAPDDLLAELLGV